MPYAETSPLREERHEQGLTQRRLAELAGLSAGTISNIERLRNPTYIAELLDQGLTPSKTTVEVVMRLAAALGLMKYNQRYTLEQVARMQTLIARDYMSDRPARCKRPYPGKDYTPRRRKTSSGFVLELAS